MEPTEVSSTSGSAEFFSHSPFRSSEFLVVIVMACTFAVADLLITVKYFSVPNHPFYLWLLFVAYGPVGGSIFLALRVHKRIRESNLTEQLPNAGPCSGLEVALRGVYDLMNTAMFLSLSGMLILLFLIYLVLLHGR